MWGEKNDTDPWTSNKKKDMKRIWGRCLSWSLVTHSHRRTGAFLFLDNFIALMQCILLKFTPTVSLLTTFCLLYQTLSQQCCIWSLFSNKQKSTSFLRDAHLCRGAGSSVYGVVNKLQGSPPWRKLTLLTVSLSGWHTFC